MAACAIPAEECLDALSGRVAFHTEHDAPAITETGDAVHIDSKMGHA